MDADLVDVVGEVAPIGADGRQDVIKDHSSEEAQELPTGPPQGPDCQTPHDVNVGATIPTSLPWGMATTLLHQPAKGDAHTHSQADPRPTTNLPSSPCLHSLETPTLDDPQPTIAPPLTPNSPTHDTTTFGILGDGHPMSPGDSAITKADWENEAPTSQEATMSLFNAHTEPSENDDAKGRFDRIWKTCKLAYGSWNPAVFPLSFTWYQSSHQLVMRHPTNGNWESQDEDEAMERMSHDGGTGSDCNLWANNQDELHTSDGSDSDSVPGSGGEPSELSDPGANTHPDNASNHPLEAKDIVGHKVWPNNPAPHYWNLTLAPPAPAMVAKPSSTTAPEQWVRERLSKNRSEEEMMQELEVKRYPHSFKEAVHTRLVDLQNIPQGPRTNHITRDSSRMAQPFQHLTWRGRCQWHCDWGKCTAFIKDLKRTKVAAENDTFGKWQEVLL